MENNHTSVSWSNKLALLVIRFYLYNVKFICKTQTFLERLSENLVHELLHILQKKLKYTSF